MTNRKCECFDPQCPHERTGHRGRCRLLYRVDMNDYPGTLMCETCQDDALDSSVFSYERLIIRSART